MLTLVSTIANKTSRSRLLMNMRFLEFYLEHPKFHEIINYHSGESLRSNHKPKFFDPRVSKALR